MLMVASTSIYHTGSSDSSAALCIPTYSSVINSTESVKAGTGPTIYPMDQKVTFLCSHPVDKPASKQHTNGIYNRKDSSNDAIM